MSSLVSKTVTGTLKHGDGTVWPSGKIVFTPIVVFGATPVTIPVKEFSVYTRSDGTFSIVLFSYDDAAVSYNCLLPSGDEFDFNLPQGSGSTTLETLRRLSYTPPETGYSHSGLTDLDADDHPQYLTETRADLLYEPLGGGGGGGVTDHGALTGLADDDHAQYHTDARGDARYSLLGHNHSGTYQPLDSDLTAIAAISPANDDVIQRKAGVWTNRTMAQVKTDLALSKSDVGLSNVPNTDATDRANHTGTQLAATISNFAATVRAITLSGLAAGSDQAIASTDTILEAFANLQAQIDGIGGGAASPLILIAGSASEIPLISKGTSSQTGDLQQWQNNSATVLMRVTSAGALAGPGAYPAQIDLSTGEIHLQGGGARIAIINGSYGMVLGSGAKLQWGSATDPYGGSRDTAFVRVAAGIVGVTDASTGGAAVQLYEMTAPAAPSSNAVRIYAEDNGSGKTRLMALFPSGSAQQIAIEP